MNSNLKDCENANALIRQIAGNLKSLKAIPLISVNDDYVDAIELTAQKLNVLMSLMLNDFDKNIKVGE